MNESIKGEQMAIAIQSFSMEEEEKPLIPAQAENANPVLPLYWTGGSPEVSLQGVANPTQGETILREFRDLCHVLYAAQSVAILGLTGLQKSSDGFPPRGTLSFVSRRSDFQTPPLSPSVPKIDLETYRLSLETDGAFTQYQYKALLVFIFQTWEDYVRPGVAKLYGVEHNHVKSHLMGDLRLVRHDIVHNQGRISPDNELPFLSQIWPVRGEEWLFSVDHIRSLMDQISALQVFVDPIRS